MFCAMQPALHAHYVGTHSTGYAGLLVERCSSEHVIEIRDVHTVMWGSIDCTLLRPNFST